MNVQEVWTRRARALAELNRTLRRVVGNDERGFVRMNSASATISERWRFRNDFLRIMVCPDAENCSILTEARSLTLATDRRSCGVSGACQR